MPLFYTVFFKIISILLSVIIGYVAGRLEKVQRESIASLLFYFIAPIVFFSVPANASLAFSDIGISVVTFTISCSACLLAYKMYDRYFDNQERNILAMSAGAGNTGYFMLPIATCIFDDYTLSIYMMCVIGVNIYESSLGYYMCARSISSTGESIKKILSMPMLHAFGIGCLFSLSGIHLPDFLDDFLEDMRSTYSILGMLMIGLGMAKIKTLEIDKKFIAASLFSKYIMYPALVMIFIMIDRYILGMYDTPEYNALLLLSSAPIAANTIVISSIMNFSPERVATSVLVSCIISLVYIPVMATITFGGG
ncbi:MAG: AEC family transporter [Alphaproteobacteria bacterium]|nr:AEC family transporter [Alphaproteobacteria bacterium]